MIFFVRKACFAYFFLLDIMELTTMPRPNPAIMEPTKYRGDIGRKKNPTPKPMITPPPIAQVLLSSFLVDIGKSHS
jgi:hypothetical protein